MKLNKYLHFLYITNRVIARSKAWLSATIFRIDYSKKLVTVGAYFSENFGDYMMGQVLRKSFQSQGLSLSTVSYDHLCKAGEPDIVICGGGELGDESYFGHVFASVNRPENVKVIGTSPYAKLHESPQSLIDNLKQVSYYSVRNKWARDYLANLLHRDDVKYSPDLVFALPKVMPSLFEKEVKESKRDLVTINLIPYGQSILRSGDIVKDQAHLDMLADLYPNMAESAQEMAERYLHYSRNLIKELLTRGKKVQVVSFTYGDYLFSRACYSDLNIDIHPFTKNPSEILNAIRASEIFYTSRFHAMIFGMLAERPIMPFCYSMKCNNLLKDIYGDRCHDFVDREQLLSQSIEDFHLRQLELEPFHLQKDELLKLTTSSYESIMELINNIKRNT